MPELLGQTRFQDVDGLWELPEADSTGFESSADGARFSAPPDQNFVMRGTGVHTRNGDSIALRFRAVAPTSGSLEFGFDADTHEHARVEFDFARSLIWLSTSDWSIPQPVASAALTLDIGESHTVVIEKSESGGNLVKNAEVRVHLDGHQILAATGLDLLPEMGVAIGVQGTTCVVEEFIHRGSLPTIPEYLHLGGWQMLNLNSIEANLASLCRGLTEAAAEGVELLVSPETSLTGLFPHSHVTTNQAAIDDAESQLRKFIGSLKNAPYLVAGLPEWKSVPGHTRNVTRYNVCRVYDPDGGIFSSHPKVHSAEDEFWHGRHLNEFVVHGVPTTLHVCHDRRYPELSTLPVMFGARLVIHPSNAGDISGNVDAFEARAMADSDTTHAFHINVNGGGGSYIVGPQREDNLIAVSPECDRYNDYYPMVGPAQESLLHAKIRVHDAFGYWPERSLRASEATAEAYQALYHQLGGGRHV